MFERHYINILQLAKSQLILIKDINIDGLSKLELSKTLDDMFYKGLISLDKDEIEIEKPGKDYLIDFEIKKAAIISPVDSPKIKISKFIKNLTIGEWTVIVSIIAIIAGIVIAINHK